jgi:hypothetical protein
VYKKFNYIPQNSSHRSLLSPIQRVIAVFTEKIEVKVVETAKGLRVHCAKYFVENETSFKGIHFVEKF